MGNFISDFSTGKFKSQNTLPQIFFCGKMNYGDEIYKTDFGGKAENMDIKNELNLQKWHSRKWN